MTAAIDSKYTNLEAIVLLHNAEPAYLQGISQTKLKPLTSIIDLTKEPSPFLISAIKYDIDSQIASKTETFKQSYNKIDAILVKELIERGKIRPVLTTLKEQSTDELRCIILLADAIRYERHNVCDYLMENAITQNSENTPNFVINNEWNDFRTNLTKEVNATTDEGIKACRNQIEQNKEQEGINNQTKKEHANTVPTVNLNDITIEQIPHSKLSNSGNGVNPVAEPKEERNNKLTFNVLGIK
jgi:hypothetical protein